MIETVLQRISKLGTIVEVNTRGIYRAKTKDHYPSDQVLKRCFELNIPIQINSDCHKPEEVARLIAVYASDGLEFTSGGIADINGASYLRS